ncbi:hypothetical protein [Leucobacter aridicollis]|uniref:Uncharacterized protein n=1 Tax=Leucobacter aridicollis TaxID=283878 RepID=A0A852R5Z5_9MICO|nr:hypothetical protein [Leucobacter aridicollis]NYD26915.1 hypothetical protein [Leucobacter aridicollis]
MLDNETWERLIQGLITATREGKLVWERRNATGTYGMAGFSRSILSTVMGKNVLRAQAPSATYEISTGLIMGAPYEFYVYRKGEGARPYAEMVKSSTEVGDPSAFKVNNALSELFRLADSSAENPDEVVDKLLGDFD